MSQFTAGPNFVSAVGFLISEVGNVSPCNIQCQVNLPAGAQTVTLLRGGRWGEGREGGGGGGGGGAQ